MQSNPLNYAYFLCGTISEIHDTENIGLKLMIFKKTDGEGLPVVLLHGWGMHSGVWCGVVDELCKQYQVTVLDLPGYGRSGWSGSCYSLETIAEQMLEVAPDNAVWIGWSLGGTIAQYIALNEPGRVAALSLVTSTPQFVQSSDWPCAVELSVLAQFSEALLDDDRATLNRFIALQVRGSVDARETLRQLRAQLFEFGLPEIAALKGGLSILQSANLRPVLKNIKCPVQMIFGERDQLVPAAVGEAMQPLLANVRIDVLSGAGHVPFISHPAEFLHATTDFLNELSL